MVTLKDGSEVPHAIFVATSIGIRAVATENILALSDLIEKCKDDRHQVSRNEFFDSQSILTKFGLLDTDKQVPDAVKKIVSNSFKGSGLAIKFVNPLRAKEITIIDRQAKL